MPVMLAVLAFTLLLTVTGETHAAVSCSDPDYKCVKMQNVSARGLNLGAQCVEEAGKKKCRDSRPLDQCVKVSKSRKCSKSSEKCVDYKNGECRQSRYVWSCFNEDSDMRPAVLTGTRWGPVEEDIISTCKKLEKNKRCAAAGITDVEGPETRIINRREFARKWWRRRRHYSCVMAREGGNDCASLKSDASCKLISSQCLSELDGVCTNREYHYRCGSKDGQIKTECTPVNVCVGETCLGVEKEPNTDFANAASWLKMTNELQKEMRENQDVDPKTLRFFSGEHMHCSKHTGRDCCDVDGVLEGLFHCSDQAKVLAERNKNGATHYTKTTCDKRVLGKCVKRRRHFCAFKTKFARVFIEQARKQSGRNWEPLDHPDCEGMTIEEIGNLDTGKMDFSEVTGDAVKGVNISTSKMLKKFYKDRFPDARSAAHNAREKAER